MGIYIRDYNSIDWKSVVYYDESSPTFLRYIDGNKARNKKNYRGANDPAGYNSFTKDGEPRYSFIKYKNKKYLIHRIVFILHFGAIENSVVINHINFNTHDSNVDNLEACSFRENLSRTKVSRKIALNSRNTSGINGVSLCIKDNGYRTYNYAKASWVDNDGNIREKLFSHDKYGAEEAWRLAVEYRGNIEIQLRLDGRL